MIDQADARWYAVALSESVPDMLPVGIQCAGQEYVLFRDSTHQVHALVDRCAHRRAALSQGSVTAGGLLQCPYHGWRYNGKTGICESIPNLAAHEPVPRAYRVDSFALVEEAGWIHLWSGGPQPSHPPVQLALASGPLQWHGESLIAFPADALADLLLDAPSVVLEIDGLTILDLHRFGDPKSTAGHVEVTYAAAAKARTSARTAAKKVIADFTRSITIRMSHAGDVAWIDLNTDTGTVVSSSIVAISPAARAVSSVKWRGRGDPRERGGARIDVRPTIDATTASRTVDYCSRLRTKIGQLSSHPMEESPHERAHY
jgi:nitrite reductase/ring-hydroxylating ferredoxin subunit